MTRRMHRLGFILFNLEILAANQLAEVNFLQMNEDELKNILK